MAEIVFILISFFASVIGCICGIGGGVIMKPVMDTFGLYSVSTISFMSGCIVLSMTAWSVVKAKVSGELAVAKGIGSWLAVGAAVGGLAGKQLFDMVKALFADGNTVGAVQAAALFAVTLGTAVYTLCRSRIRTRQVSGALPCVIIGLALGIMSSFLGIGGGPINLVVLYYFFSMETKAAAQNSLYVILFSQLASTLFTLLSGNVPEFPVVLLLCMVCCGILGAVVGRRINKKIDDRMVSRLFIGLLVVIMGICCYNFALYI